MKKLSSLLFISILFTYNLSSSALHDAASAGNVQKIRQLLKKGTQINAQDDQYKRPLHLSVEKGNLSATKELLKSDKIKVNATDGWLNTPLHIAVEKNHIDIVRELLKAPGIDVNPKESLGVTPLYLAAQYGYVEIVRLLLEAGANECICRLLGPLHMAAQNGYRKCVSLMLAAGFDVNIKDRNKRTPLHLASEHGHEDVTFLLIISGADSNAIAYYPYKRFHKTPLEIADRDEVKKVFESSEQFLSRKVEIIPWLNRRKIFGK